MLAKAKKKIKNISVYNNYSFGFEEKRVEVKRMMRKYGFHSSPNGDAVIVIGGDGTFLGAVKEKSKNGKNPLFIGVNDGNLGFFYEYSFEDLETVFRMLKNKRYKIISHPMYEMEIYFENDDVYKEIFVNDLVIERGSEKIIHLNLDINFDFSTKFSGDGIIVSTSLGSSAYNYSVGGSVILDKLNILQITPISPVSNKIYTSLYHPIIMSDENHIFIEEADVKKRKIRIVSDGYAVPIKQGIKGLKIKRSQKYLNIIRSETFNLMNHIKGKLY